VAEVGAAAAVTVGEDVVAGIGDFELHGGFPQRGTEKSQDLARKRVRFGENIPEICLGIPGQAEGRIRGSVSRGLKPGPIPGVVMPGLKSRPISEAGASSL
jgi:hypothetical protein